MRRGLMPKNRSETLWLVTQCSGKKIINEKLTASNIIQEKSGEEADSTVSGGQEQLEIGVK